VHVCQGQSGPCRQGIAAGVHFSGATAAASAAAELRANELGAATTAWTSATTAAEFWVNEPDTAAATTRTPSAAATTLIRPEGVSSPSGSSAT
jgi:hypothetical protein